MTTPLNAATSAYTNASRLVTMQPLPMTDLQANLGPINDFASMLASNVQSVLDKGQASDALAIDMVNGKANVIDMVTALSETEMAIESMVTLRDRVISAYEEIMRMSI
ncbi:flagellar hook-basal body complex protein FliE [Devosia sp. WQ 349]|nr:flagellar hook-basal body complex protein FliE [Devosia sp. WQ 349K1]